MSSAEHTPMAANANADAAQLPDPANAAGRASENSSVSDAPVGTDIHLTLLMVSSARASLTFKPEDTVLSVKETLLRSWPKDFDAKPAGPGNLRIVYLGHFLEDGDTLAESKLQPGSTTVHLTIKATAAPEKAAKKDVDKAPKCTCIIL